MAIETKANAMSVWVRLGLLAAIAPLSILAFGGMNGCSSSIEGGASPLDDAGPASRSDAAHASDGGGPGVTGPDGGVTDGGPIVDPTGGGDSSSTGDDGSAPEPLVRVVGYLPNYSGSYADWANKIDFSKMTHLNLAFASATGSNDWDMGASDDEVKAIVDAAHKAGVRVLPSLGGGGGDQSVIARYKDTNNIDPLIDNLDKFITRLNFDGADVDIEDGSNLGQNYSTFITKMVAKLRPKGKLVTAAVAQYLQDSMADTTLHDFDFVNVMVYSNYNDGVSALDFYTKQKGMAPTAVTLGAGFFGTDNSGNEYSYSDIMKADGNAWNKDQANVNGQTVNYTGMASMKKIAEYSKGFGGIMFWELSEDTTDAHSLYKVIQGAM